MDEARRFLRFVLPGGVFVLQTTLLLLLLFPGFTLGHIKAAVAAEASGAAIAVAGLLVSGLLGFVLG